MQFFKRKISDVQIGFLFMFVTVFCFPTMDVFAKILTKDLPIFQIVWARYLGQFIIILLIFFPTIGKISKTKFLKIQLFRSIALFCGTIGFFSALKYLTLAETTAIMMIAPLLITLLAFIFLNETFGLYKIFCLIIGLIGSFLVIKPQSGSFQIHMFLPFIAAFSYSIYQLLTRFLGNSESPKTTLFYTAGFGAVMTSIFVPFIWVTPTNFYQIFFMVCMPIFGGIGHYCLILALTKVEATTLAPINYMSLVFAMFWGYVVFFDLPQISTLFGSLLIVLSGIYLWYRN